MSQPNIIVCMCDQLRAVEIGCYGHPVVRTPNLDRLASEGARFETAITNAPVCMAARSALLSGQYNRTCTGGIGNVSFPSRPGDFNMPEYPYDGRLHLRDTTLPELLREAGYETNAIGKWHIHSWPHDIGFDHYVIPRVHHCHTGQCFTEDGGPEFVPDGYSVDYEAERVEQLLQARAGSEQPFFLYYNISVPHCPLADVPEAYRAMYDPASVMLRPNVNIDVPLAKQDYWFKVYRHDFRYYNLHLPYTERLPEGYSLRHLIAEYWGATTWMDAAVGRMLAALDATGLAENTVVVFVSDHGDCLGSHGLVQKGTPIDESIRIPMLVRGPGLPSGRVVTSHVGSLVDLAPTLLDMAGTAAPNHMPGRNLAPLCRGEASEVAPHAFAELGRWIAARSPSHMVCVPYAEGTQALAAAPSQCFDAVADPYQLHNLAATVGCAELAELEGLIRAWNEATPRMAS